MNGYEQMANQEMAGMRCYELYESSAFGVEGFNIDNFTKFSKYFTAIEGHEHSKYFCPSQDTQDSYWERTITLPPIFDIWEYTRIFEVLESANSAREAAEKIWDCMRHSQIDKYIEFLNYFACDEIFEELVSYGIYYHIEEAHAFVGEVLDVYNGQTQIGDKILKAIAEATGFQLPIVILKIMRQDGEEKHSKHKIRRVIRDGLRRKEFLKERKITHCGICTWQLSYMPAGGWALSLGGRMPCCGVIVHPSCFWEKLNESQFHYFCRKCGSKIDSNTGKLIHDEFDCLYNTLLRLGLRDKLRIPIVAEIAPPKR